MTSPRARDSEDLATQSWPGPTRPCLANLDAWIERDFAYAGNDIERLVERRDVGTCMLIRVRTSSALYEIRVEPWVGNDGGQIVCEARCTTYRPGDSRVGRRLVSGYFAEETWFRVLAAIVSYELRPLVERPSTPLAAEIAAAAPEGAAKSEM